MASAAIRLAVCADRQIERAPEGLRRTDRIIVSFRSGHQPLLDQRQSHDSEARNALKKRLACHAIRPLGRHIGGPAGRREALRRVHLLEFDAATNIDSVITRYRAMDIFEQAEPDYLARFLDGFIPNDPHFFRLWWLNNDATYPFNRVEPVAGADLSMPGAWQIEQGDSSIIVAIIDSGCRLTHPDFDGRIWENPGEIPDNGLDDDRNGYIDDIQGWDFAEEDNTPQDTLGHGTAVIGALGATGNNDYGLTGIDWHCKLMVLRVGVNNIRWSAFSQIYEAILYAVDNGAHVINLSLGHEQRSSAIERAIDFAVDNGVTVVAASGNENTSPVLFPARYEPVIAVGSSSPDDHRSDQFLDIDSAGGSNYGPSLDLIAPGDYIIINRYDSDSNFIYQNAGTSFAAPMVSGIASLLLAQNPLRTPEDIRTIIQETADDLVGDPVEDTPGWDQYHGYGRANGFRALSRDATANTTSPAAAVQHDFSCSISRSRIMAHWTADTHPGTALIITVISSQGRTIDRIRCSHVHGQIYSGAVTEPLANGMYVVRAELAQGGTTARRSIIIGSPGR
jgi:subtilisin family serine protease